MLSYTIPLWVNFFLKKQLFYHHSSFELEKRWTTKDLFTWWLGCVLVLLNNPGVLLRMLQTLLATVWQFQWRMGGQQDLGPNTAPLAISIQDHSSLGQVVSVCYSQCLLQGKREVKRPKIDKIVQVFKPHTNRHPRTSRQCSKTNPPPYNQDYLPLINMTSWKSILRMH